MMGTAAIILVLMSLPATWYQVHVVGPNFNFIGPDGPEPEDEKRQLRGRWYLGSYKLSEQIWDTDSRTVPDIWTPYDLYGQEDGTQLVNEHAREVYAETTIFVAGGIAALGVAAFGTWNVAMKDRYRWFTTATYFLAAVLLIGGCYHYGMGLPEAMWSDSASGHEDSFGLVFSPYIDPEGGEPGYYFEFDGGYPNNDPRFSEQLDYGPGIGWWLAGAAGIMALLTSAVMVAAPSIVKEREGATQTVEVVRHVPVPTVTNVRRQRRYPKRMPAISRNSPTYKRRRG
jgi:hypothetical protein